MTMLPALLACLGQTKQNIMVANHVSYQVDVNIGYHVELKPTGTFKILAYLYEQGLQPHPNPSKRLQDFWLPFTLKQPRTAPGGRRASARRSDEDQDAPAGQSTRAGWRSLVCEKPALAKRDNFKSERQVSASTRETKQEIQSSANGAKDLVEMWNCGHDGSLWPLAFGADFNRLQTTDRRCQKTLNILKPYPSSPVDKYCLDGPSYSVGPEHP